MRSSEQDVMDQYKVKSLPTMMIIRNLEKKNKVYDGEMKYKPLFEFLNIYSEAFVAGGGSAQDTAATKSWMTEMVP